MENKKIIEAFVIVPFGNNQEYRDANNESNYVFESIIKPAIEDVFTNKVIIKVTRGVDRNIPRPITTEIIKSIARSDIVVTDLTGRNPNVFLELGRCYASFLPN
jgi:hypothetical protein